MKESITLYESILTLVGSSWVEIRKNILSKLANSFSMLNDREKYPFEFFFNFTFLKCNVKLLETFVKSMMKNNQAEEDKIVSHIHLLCKGISDSKIDHNLSSNI